MLEERRRVYADSGAVEVIGEGTLQRSACSKLGPRIYDSSSQPQRQGHSTDRQRLAQRATATVQLYRSVILSIQKKRWHAGLAATFAPQRGSMTSVSPRPVL